MWDVLAAEELSSCFSLCALLTQPISVTSTAALKRRIFYKESSNWLFCCGKFSATTSEAHPSFLMATSNSFTKTPRKGDPDTQCLMAPLLQKCWGSSSPPAFVWLLTTKQVWGMGRFHQLEEKHPSLCLRNTPGCHWPWGHGALGGQVLFNSSFKSFLGRWELSRFVSQ